MEVTRGSDDDKIDVVIREHCPKISVCPAAEASLRFGLSVRIRVAHRDDSILVGNGLEGIDVKSPTGSPQSGDPDSNDVALPGHVSVLPYNHDSPSNRAMVPPMIKSYSSLVNRGVRKGVGKRSVSIFAFSTSGLNSWPSVAKVTLSIPAQPNAFPKS